MAEEDLNEAEDGVNEDGAEGVEGEEGKKDSEGSED